MKKRIGNLDGLRVYWALIIVLSHFFNEYGSRFSCPAFLLRGHLGAEGFFVLSGFLYALRDGEELGRGDPLRKGFSLYMKNMKRFFLIHFLTALPFAVRTARQGLWSGKYSVIGVMNLFLVQNWIPGKDYSFNGVAWFLSDLMFICFIMPFLFRTGAFLKKKVPAVVRVPAACLAAAGVPALAHRFLALYKEPLFACFGPFLLGAVLADLVESIGLAPGKRRLCLPAAALLALGYPAEPPRWILLYDSLICAAVILLLYVSEDGLPFSGRLLRGAGRSSLYTLLIHYPLCALEYAAFLEKTGPSRPAALGALAAFTAASFLLGAGYAAAEQALRRRFNR